ncbi:MAG: NADH-quinone oxidoreductase subunit C [Lysobacterales bacterium]
MRLADFDTEFTPSQSTPPVYTARVDAAGWRRVAAQVAGAGGRLVALWGSDRRADADAAVVISAAYASAEGLLWVQLPVVDVAADFPDLTPWFAGAERMQRALADLLGVGAADALDQRPWLDHGLWPPGFKPLRGAAEVTSAADGASAAPYDFVRVQGDGVHEIAVGPVHAGIIEPGHFRFSVVGEKVLRLEQRLRYTHKGIERRFTELRPVDGVRLAGRVSGDSTVAYAFAYCMALEAAAAASVSPRAAALRGLLLEYERIANHLGDLGAIGNDAGLAIALAQFSRLREDWLRLAGELFGHRLLMDCIVPGGVARDLDAAAGARLVALGRAIEVEVLAMRRLVEEHAGLQDRLIGTGRVSSELAAQLGLTGLAARASGIAIDLRCLFPVAPYDRLAVRMACRPNGDVAARVLLRFDEIAESLRLIRVLIEQLPAGLVRGEIVVPSEPAFGIGWVEGWRGEVLVALELAPQDGVASIRRCHCHDPSWQNWPVLEHAVIGNIVPDFPLINKSFNLSYAGQDL